MYLSGHQDPWVFSFGNASVFEKYCHFNYLEGADDTRTDGIFDCPELAMIKYMGNIQFMTNACKPFYQYDKTKPITDFIYRDTSQKLIAADGTFVVPVTGDKK